MALLMQLVLAYIVTSSSSWHKKAWAHIYAPEELDMPYVVLLCAL